MARTESDLSRILEELATLKDSVATLARDGVAEAGGAMRSAANSAGTIAADKGEEAVTALRGTIRDRPIASVAAAFAFGISVARLLVRR